MIGGGETRALEKAKEKSRQQGRYTDNMKYIRIHDVPAVPDAKFNIPIQDVCEAIALPKGCAKPLNFKVLPYSINQNSYANPGPTFSSMGFCSKIESIPVAWDLARHIYAQAEMGSIKGKFIPRYQMNGRSKLKETKKFREKLEKGDPIGRPVEMPTNMNN